MSNSFIFLADMHPQTIGYWLLGLASFVLVLVSVVPHTKRVRLLTFAAWVVMSLLTVAYDIFWQLTGKGFNQSIPYHLRFGMQGAGVADFHEMRTFATSAVLLLLVGSFGYCRFAVKPHHTRHGYYAGAAILLILLAAHPLWSEIYDTYKTQEISPVPFDEHYAVPVLRGGDPSTYPNVVWIYAESFERTYLDQKLFPGLTPEMTKLEQESLSCTDVREVHGTEWTVAGLVSSQCGIPLVKLDLDRNRLGERMRHFLPGAVGFGDLLHEKDYDLEFMMGVSGAFGGTAKFLQDHRFQVTDLAPILAAHPDFPSEDWGISDDLLFGLAQDRYAELQQAGRPFVLMLATIDTHHPVGKVPPSFHGQYADGGNSSLNAIHASDSIIADFVRSIRRMDTTGNTLIVVTSDHLAMPNACYDQLAAGERRNLLLYNWPGKIQPEKIDKPACSFDKGATALELMGFNVTALGLGRSLVSDEKTFVENFADPDRQLRGWEYRINEFWK